MKKTSARRRQRGNKDELRREYRFNYRKSKPNRFASRMSEDSIAIVLEPDTATIFKSSKTVNALLRSIILAMTESSGKKPTNLTR